MPDFKQSLQGQDLGHLRIIAELWGVELQAPDIRSGVQHLTSLLLHSDLIGELLDTLPSRALEGLRDLLQNEGKLTWALFTRRYGDVREMGPAKRDREHPYLNANASPAESLWYRALVGRGFFDTLKGPEEYAYVPEDLLKLLPISVVDRPEPFGRPASPHERQNIIKAGDSLLDDACTLLAAQRVGIPLDEDFETLLLCTKRGSYPLTAASLLNLLEISGILDADGIPKPDETRQFLESDRSKALLFLVNSWLQSPNFDEMRLLPGVTIEGEWQTDPLRTRQILIDLLSRIPFNNNQDLQKSGHLDGLFWSMNAFINSVKANMPDFQRPAGDYDSWYVRIEDSDIYLRGYQHWDKIDGELLRFIIAGPMYWLGLTDLAISSSSGEDSLGRPTAFRLSNWSKALLNNALPPNLVKEDELMTIRADGRIRVPVLAPRVARYQVARFGEWQGFKDGFYRFRLIPDALYRARKQGLRVDHLLTLLKRYAAGIPPKLMRALRDWEAKGSQARLMDVSVLRVRDPAVLDALRSSPTARYLGETLGPTSVIIRSGASEKVMMALAEMGILAEIIQEDA